MDASPIAAPPVEEHFPGPEAVSRRFASAPVEGGLGVRVAAMADRRDPQPERLRLTAPLRVGTPHLVTLAVATDTAIGIAVHSATPTQTSGPTLDLRLDAIADPAPGARSLEIVAEVLGTPTADDRAGAARALVTDDTGRTVAHGIATMVIEPFTPRTPGRRPGTVDGPQLDVSRLVRTLATAPLTDDTLTLPLGPWLGNLRGTMHGGLVLAVGRLAAQRITGSTGRMLDTAVEYLRPVPLAGTLTCRIVPERVGRRFRTDRTELVLPDGKIAAIVRSATASG
ncbi:acyl-CoA thioesterase domain-containing protein [Pseudonocardia sp. WMMC193]|uniref:PaaI family thioesterase n=1 Tax=Pseudonocardia sp. WMMC193 TaxID=2911965 RepID=UPI001F247D9F|nr:acyl-CoA thioesterase domain-containing protein [Pseudonocardia sp. WMMC193]MCF7548305.1 hypothetical protein [Pseudonocardia sp. WMMC193]